MRVLNLGLVIPMVLLVFAGCGGGSNSGTGGTTGTGGAAGTGVAGSGGASGVAGAGGSATGTGGSATGTGGSATGTGGGGGGATGGAGNAGTGGSAPGGTGGGAVSCIGTDIDIPSTLVTGTFKINGATVTATTDSGAMSLRTAGGDLVPLGSTAASSYSVRAVPGTYDLYYQVSTPGATAPRNTGAKLRSVVIGASTTALDIDVPSVVVTGALKINGVAVTAATDAGTVTLRNGTDIVTLGSTTTGSYSVRVVPGTYDVYYQASASTSSAPRNQVAKLRSVTVAATGTTALDIDIPSVVASGMLKIGGVAVTAATDTGLITLRNAAGDQVPLGSTMAGTYSARVIPGAYDVYYQATVTTTMAPRNQLAKLQAITIAATGTTAIDIDVPAVVTSGTFKIGGAAVTAATDAGNMFLRTAAGDSVALGSTSAGSFSLRVVPGTYDLYYVLGAAGTTAPRNQNAKLQSVTVTPTGTNAFDIDVPSAVAAGTFKINGAAVASATDAGTLSLRNGTGDIIALGSTSAGTYSVRAIPGTYDVYYTTATPGASAPRNTLAKIRTGVVVAAGTTAIDIDVPSSNVTGTFRINSAAATSTADYGILTLRSGTDAISLGNSYASTFTVRVVPGTYDVYYQLGAAGTLAPRNTLATLRCLAVP